MLNIEEKNNQRRLLAVTIVVVLTAFLVGEQAIVIFTFIALVMFVFLLMRAVSPKEMTHISRVINFFRFFFDFVYDIFKSNFVLAFDVFTPRDYHRSQLISVPIEDLTPLEVAIISHRITITPGTLSCVITEDKKILIVHSMYSSKNQHAAKTLRRPIDILKGTA